VASLEIIVSAVLVLSCGHTESQTQRQTDTHTEKDADERSTPSTLVGVSNNKFYYRKEIINLGFCKICAFIIF